MYITHCLSSLLWISLWEVFISDIFTVCMVASLDKVPLLVEFRNTGKKTYFIIILVVVSRVVRVSVCVGLLFSLYRNSSHSTFLLYFSDESFASTCSASLGEVLKALVYILMPSLCTLPRF